MDQLWQGTRYALIAGGAFLAGKGYMTMDQVNSLVEAVPKIVEQTQLIVGAATTIGSVAWGLYVKWNTKAVPDHVAARPTIQTVSAATGAIEPADKYRG